MKIAKKIASALKIAGWVVLILALVMTIYVPANDSKGWASLSNALVANGQKTNVFTRIGFDRQYFSAMMDAVGTKTLSSDVRTAQARKFFAEWENKMAAGQLTIAQQELDAFYAELEQNFNVQDYLAFYEQMENNEEGKLISEAIAALNEAFTPAAPKGKKIKIVPVDCTADVEAFYQTFSQEHGEEAGAYVEFVETLAAMVKNAESRPAKINSFMESMSFEDYAAALATLRETERETISDIREEFVLLLQSNAEGKALDLSDFFDTQYAALCNRYSEVSRDYPNVFAETLYQQLQDENFDGTQNSLVKAFKTAVTDTESTGYSASLDKLAALAVEKSDANSTIGLIVVLWWLAARYILLWAVGILLVVAAALLNKLTNKITLARLENAGIEEDPDILLRVNHLKQYFQSGEYINKAVDDVSFYIKKGEVFGLVGESGCGKTTTGRTIINLYDPTEGDVYFQGLRISSTENGLPVLIRSLNSEFEEKKRLMEAALKENIEKNPADKAKLTEAHKAKLHEMKNELNRKISVARTNALESSVEKSKCVEKYREKRKAELTEAYNQDIKNLTGQAAAERKERYEQDMKVAAKDNIMTKMQMIFQDPIASINPRMTVREIIAEGLKIRGIRDEKYINEKVYEVLDLVGLVREHADRYPHEFSGGQRQRIGIARAIVLEPDLIIADEPISALDVSIQAQVINLLNDLRNKMGLTIMFIAHNLSVVKYFSDRIGVMYYGKLVELATSDELFEHPLHPYTKSLLSAIPYPDPHHEKHRKRIEYNPLKEHDYSVDKPTLREITPGHYINCNDAEYEQYKKELGL